MFFFPSYLKGTLKLHLTHLCFEGVVSKTGVYVNVFLCYSAEWYVGLKDKLKSGLVHFQYENINDNKQLESGQDLF